MGKIHYPKNLPFWSVIFTISLISGCGRSTRLPLQHVNATSTIPATKLPPATMTSTYTPYAKSTNIQSPTAGHTSTKTQTLVPTSTSKPTPTPTISITPTPTGLPDEIIHTWILEKMQNRDDCLFPCWWGITPGKTTWEEANALISPYATEIDIMVENEHRFVAGAFFDWWPPEALEKARIYIGFEVRDGVVSVVVIDGIDTVADYSMPGFLAKYGEPGGIWINAYSPMDPIDNASPRDIAIHIYYPLQGLFLLYQAPIGDVKDGIIRNCIEFGPAIYLWAPEPDLSYEDAIKRLGLQFEFKFLPVTEALGMDIHTFFQKIKDLNDEVCLETSLNVWFNPTPAP